ncbi:hypothetical protein LXL04_038952 [Taraxacum kok-saghyz]
MKKMKMRISEGGVISMVVVIAITVVIWRRWRSETKKQMEGFDIQTPLKQMEGFDGEAWWRRRCDESRSSDRGNGSRF